MPEHIVNQPPEDMHPTVTAAVTRQREVVKLASALQLVDHALRREPQRLEHYSELARIMIHLTDERRLGEAMSVAAVGVSERFHVSHGLALDMVHTAFTILTSELAREGGLS